MSKLLEILGSRKNGTTSETVETSLRGKERFYFECLWNVTFFYTKQSSSYTILPFILDRRFQSITSIKAVLFSLIYLHLRNVLFILCDFFHRHHLTVLTECAKCLLISSHIECKPYNLKCSTGALNHQGFKLSEFFEERYYYFTLTSEGMR